MKITIYNIILLFLAFSRVQSQTAPEYEIEFYKDFDLYSLKGLNQISENNLAFPYIEVHQKNGTIHKIRERKSEQHIEDKIFYENPEYFWSIDTTGCAHDAICVEVMYFFRQEEKIITITYKRKSIKKGKKWGIQFKTELSRNSSTTYLHEKKMPKGKLYPSSKRLFLTPREKYIDWVYESLYRSQNDTVFQELKIYDQRTGNTEIEHNCYLVEPRFGSWWSRYQEGWTKVGCPE